MPGPGPTLEARALTCEKGDRLLFHDLSVGLEAGEVLMVKGANGTGKTSLLRILAGLSLPAEGEVFWSGQPIRRRRWEYQSELAYVGHRHGIKDHLSTAENLALMLRLAGRASGIEPEDALRRLGLEGRSELQGRLLSAGQRRRVALARLLTAARLWILDEPLTALDRRGVETVETLLVRHASSGGMAVVTSHHPLALDGVAVRELMLGHG